MKANRSLNPVFRCYDTRQAVRNKPVSTALDLLKGIVILALLTTWLFICIKWAMSGGGS